MNARYGTGPGTAARVEPPPRHSGGDMSKTACAYHEAGHVVAARVFGWYVMSAELHLKPHIHGLVETSSPSDPNKIHAAIVALAGPAAELFHRPLSRREFEHACETGWQQDVENAVKAVGAEASEDLDKAVGLEALEALDEIFILARILIEHHWAAVEQVAQALLKYRSLDVETLAWVLDEPPRAVSFCPAPPRGRPPTEPTTDETPF